MIYIKLMCYVQKDRRISLHINPLPSAILYEQPAWRRIFYYGRNSKRAESVGQPFGSSTSTPTIFSFFLFSLLQLLSRIHAPAFDNKCGVSRRLILSVRFFLMPDLVSQASIGNVPVEHVPNGEYLTSEFRCSWFIGRCRRCSYEPRTSLSE